MKNKNQEEMTSGCKLKLRLHRETLRRLSDRDLTGARGGMQPAPDTKNGQSAAAAAKCATPTQCK